MTWIVHIHDGAAKQLRAIPPDRRQRVLDDIAVFQADPFRGLVKPLKGRDHKGHYRNEHRGGAGRSPPQRKDLSMTTMRTASSILEHFILPLTGHRGSAIGRGEADNALRREARLPVS
jgi:hypothetical protein